MPTAIDQYHGCRCTSSLQSPSHQRPSYWRSRIIGSFHFVEKNMINMDNLNLEKIQTCLLFFKIMMASSNGNIFCVTGPLWKEFTGTGGFRSQRPVTRSFDVFLDLRLNTTVEKTLEMPVIIALIMTSPYWIQQVKGGTPFTKID